MIRPSLLDSSFNETEILKIVMQDVGITHHPLFSRKNNTGLSALLKINYCDDGSIHVSPVNQHTLLIQFISENKFYTLLKKLIEADIPTTFTKYSLH